MHNPSESTRRCLRQTAFGVLAAGATWFSGWFSETPLPIISLPSCSHQVLLHFLHNNFKAFHFFFLLKDYVVSSFVFSATSFIPRAHDLCAIQTHSTGWKTQSNLETFAIEEWAYLASHL